MTDQQMQDEMARIKSDLTQVTSCLILAYATIWRLHALIPVTGMGSALAAETSQRIAELGDSIERLVDSGDRNRWPS